MVSGQASAVVMRGVGFTASGEAGEPGCCILQGIDLEVPRGGLFHIVGPSGAGKTRLLRLINRLDEAACGRIEVLGRPIDQWPVRELRRRVGLVFQQPTLLGMNVRENLELPFRIAGSLPRDLDERQRQAMALAGVAPEFGDRIESRLSVGQKHRITVARSLLTEPELLLLDEPTAGLDPATARTLLDSLVSLNTERGLTLIMVTHRLSEARRMGGTMAVLIKGCIVATGDVQQLTAEPPPGQAGDFLRTCDE